MAGVEIPAQVQISPGYPLGLAYLGVVIDAGSEVDETNENDNQAGIALLEPLPAITQGDLRVVSAGRLSASIPPLYHVPAPGG